MGRKKFDTSIVKKIEVDHTTKKTRVVDVPESE